MLAKAITTARSVVCALLFVGMMLINQPAIAGWFPFGSDSGASQPNESERLREPPKAALAALQIGQAAPDFAFPVLEVPEASPQPAMHSPAAWRGKTVFINFFASWCAPCRKEWPLLQQLKDDGRLWLVGVGHYDRPNATQTMLDLMGNPFALVLQDTLGRGGKAWGVRGIPDSFILSPQGKIIWHHRGPLTEAIVDDEIMPLLK